MKPSACLIALVAALTAANARAIEIEVAFLGDPFFSQDPVARAAVEAAARHVGDALTSSLTPIDQTAFTDTAGDTTATLDWSFGFRDEATDTAIGALPVTVADPTLPADTVRVFVDAQPLDDQQDVGLGVPSGAMANIGASFVPPLNAAAIQGVAGQADAEMNRGGQGPLIGVLFEGQDNLNGDIDVDPVRFRSSFGGIAFDNDTNNDGFIDSDAQLRDFWHLDHTTAVPATKIDLFSVAVSEILAALGFGGSDSFEELADGVDWLGPEAIALLGDGAGLLDPVEGGAILAGTLSTRFSDGAQQEAALDPDIQPGVREELTLLDLALLRDIGWQTIDITTLSGDYNGDGVVNTADYATWRDNLGAAPGTLPNDPVGSVIGAEQYDAWVASAGSSVNAPVAVSIPEPSAAVLALVLLATRSAFLTPR